MVGYHYTSYKNYLRIKKEGLKLYNLESSDNDHVALDKSELRPYFKGEPKGIWIWKYKMLKPAHVGCLLFQAITKPASKVVYLRVKYNLRDVLSYKGNELVIVHGGYLGNWYYHNYHDKEESVIITKPIPPKDIELIKVYDLFKLLS